jgi:hypothetical protein
MVSTAEKTGFPRSIILNEEPEGEGTYVSIGEGHTRDYGSSPLLVLTVSDEQRTFWLFNESALLRVMQELARRPGNELTPGERVRWADYGKKKNPNTNREFRHVEIEFPDAPKPTGSALLGKYAPASVKAELAEAQKEEPSSDDDGIPF